MAEERKTSLTKRDVNRVIARWYITTEMSLNYERMQSIAYTYALIPALKKLYPNKEDMIPALQRHLELFNTNATAGGLILGTTLAMEEEKANNPDAIPSESIVAVKTGLMGPVAALGDSFSAGTITTLFILASCSLAQGGSIAGFWLLLLGTDIFQYHTQIHPRYDADFLRILWILQQSRTAVAGRAEEQIAKNHNTLSSIHLLYSSFQLLHKICDFLTWKKT